MSVHIPVQKTQERHLVERFRAEKAISADTARALIPLDSTQRAAWKRLQRRGVIREAGRGRFYLDRHRLAETRQLHRIVMFAVVGLVVTGAVVQLIMSRP